MKINTKFDVPVLNYQFEPNDDEYLEKLMKNGITKHAASLMLGNNSIISQPSLMKKFEEKQSFTILNERGQKVYFDINEAKISNVNLFEEIGEQILQLRLFGFYNIKLLEIQKNYLTLSLSYLDDNGFVHSSNLLFCTLSSLNYKNVKNIYDNQDSEQQINHALIFNDNLLLKNDYDIKKMLLRNGNVLVDKNKYEFINEHQEIEIYNGSSFYNSQKFMDLVKNGESEVQISVDDINKIHEFRLEKNGFDIADSDAKFNFDNDSNKYSDEKKKQYLDFLNKQIKHDYLQSLFTVTNNEISSYYNNYLNNKSFSEYLDILIINMLNTKIKFNSFREFELAFKLSYYKKHRKDYISNEDIDNQINNTIEDKNTQDNSLVEVEKFDDTPVETQQEQQTVDASQEQQTVDASQEQQTVDTSQEQQAVDASQEQQTVDASQEQQTEDTGWKQQTEDASQEQQTVDAGWKQQTEDASQEQQTEDTGWKQQTEETQKTDNNGQLNDLYHQIMSQHNKNNQNSNEYKI